jgi:hypothetical protein
MEPGAARQINNIPLSLPYGCLLNKIRKSESNHGFPRRPRPGRIGQLRGFVIVCDAGGEATPEQSCKAVCRFGQA